MKKLLSILLVVAMLFGISSIAFAAKDDDTKTLHFNADGKFKIMMVNDYQDVQNTQKKSAEFLAKALDTEKPDLVVLVGDQLCDIFPFANADKIRKSIDNIIAPLKERDIPFLMTMGNHDHDRTNVVSKDDQMAIYHSYSNCYAALDGYDGATYNQVIYGSDKATPIFSVYMMDTNNKDENGGYCGVNSAQVEWYKNKSDELKELNGGNILPSITFQHIPVKEIYSLLNVVEYGENDDAIYSTVGRNWYALDPNKMISDTYHLGEAPCSEDLTKTTGQYEAWLEKGDMTLGAYFAHDHLNNFVGKTDDGIILGYNAGTGFKSYGDGGNRSVRVFVFDENDVENYDTYSVRYNDLFTPISFYYTDLFSPALITPLMKAIYAVLGNIIKLIKQ